MARYIRRKKAHMAARPRLMSPKYI
jgi:hypothetical protein